MFPIPPLPRAGEGPERSEGGYPNQLLHHLDPFSRVRGNDSERNEWSEVDPQEVSLAWLLQFGDPRDTSAVEIRVMHVPWSSALYMFRGDPRYKSSVNVRARHLP